MTLYDSLDDDEFEGTEGVDDKFDYPRIFIEYQVVSSQFTTMVNELGKMGSAIDLARKRQDERLEDRVMATAAARGAT